MKQSLLLAAFILATILAQAQPYTIGTKNITFTDPARSNRSIAVEIRYPGTNTAMVNDSFPFIVFGHGFQMTGNNYYSVFDSLVRQGYIVALPGTETSFSPSHSDFGKDFIFIYGKLISESQTNSSSFLYNHVIPRGAIGGHSMGGGSTVLSCQFGTPATCYFTFAAANTNPSSIAAAPSMNKPYLAIAGSRDCIAPPAANQVPMYDSSGAPCKVYVSILDATHCQFGPNSVACNFGEGVSGCASTPLSSTAQVSKTLAFLTPYLNYYLKQQCSAWTQFEALYAANTTDDLRRNCTNTIPTNPGITGDNSFCAGSNTVLTAAPAGFTYSWSDATTTQTNTVSTAGTYGVTVSNGVCAVTATPVAVTETALPGTPSSITMPDTVCAG
ncbi:MAG TPA: hypothetical protein VK174_00780, partial [Chitinophagales bacterium]|nr:hypothetical protein [Chitinophagales bacterium]